MTNNTDPVRALIAKWQAAPYGKGDHDYYVDGLRACARELEASLAQQAGAEPVAYVDLANWHGGLRADECFFTDWQDDDTVPLYLSQQTAAPSGEAVAEVTSDDEGDMLIRALRPIPLGAKLYTAPQQASGADEFAADRERLLRAFMMECGIIGAKEAGVNLARGIKAALAAQQQEGE